MQSQDDVILPSGVDRLIITEDGTQYVLGRPDLGVYVAVPEPGAVFIRALQHGEAVDVATARASAAAGEPVDGADFVAGLTAAGLLDPPAEGHGPADGPPPNRHGVRIRWIEAVSPTVARRLFGVTAWCGYATAAVVAACILVVRPDLRPSFEHAFFLPDAVLSTLAFLGIGLAGVAMHEFWHWLAGRAAGVSATFRVSHRGFYLVFETDLTNLVALPRRNRYGPFLAGMAFDVTVLALALLLRLAHRTDLLALAPVVDRLLGVLVLTNVFALVWQCAAVFLRSDCYAVLANALRCNNLYRATQLTTKERLWRLSDAETEELRLISPHDRRVARWFGIVYLAGMFGLGWAFLTLALPYLLAMGSWLVVNLLSLAPTRAAFWESVIVLVLLAVQWLTPPLLAVRERRLRRGGGLR